MPENPSRSMAAAISSVRARRPGTAASETAGMRVGHAATVLRRIDRRPAPGGRLRCDGDERRSRPLTVVALLLHDRELSPVELAEHTLGRIEELDGDLHAFVTSTR